MRRAPHARTLAGAALLLVLAGCVAPWTPTVVVDRGAAARLRTTQRYGLFLTTVRIDGREVGPFVVDTGANELILDVEAARTLDLRFSARHYDPVTKQTVTSVAIGSLQAGPVTLRNMPAVVMDLAAVAGPLGQRPAGALGYPFFAKAVVEFDYVRRSVSCFAPGAYRLPDARSWQPLIVRRQHPGVLARVEGGEGEFLLDTGSTLTLYLSKAFLDKPLALRIRDVRSARSVGIAG